MATATIEHRQSPDKPESRMPKNIQKFAHAIISRFTHSPEALTSDKLLEQIPEDLPPYRRLGKAARLQDELADSTYGASLVSPVIDTLSQEALNDFTAWTEEMKLLPHQRSEDKKDMGLGLSIDEVMGCIHAWEVHPTSDTKKVAIEAIKFGGGEGSWSTRYDSAFQLLIAEKKSDPDTTKTFREFLDQVNDSANNAAEKVRLSS